MTKKQFYASWQWRSVRAEVLRRDLYTCHDCYDRASEVHHIIELTADNIEDYNISLNPDNLMSLCKSCHTKRTNGYEGDLREGYTFNENGEVIEQ